MTHSISIFDYIVTIKRRGNYLVVSCPELDLHLGSIYIHLVKASPELIGNQVLRVFEKINIKLLQMEQVGKKPPDPMSVRGIKVVSTGTMTIGEASKLLGVSTSTLRRIARRGLIGCYQTPGGHLRFAPNSLADYFLEQQNLDKKVA